jgi:hypothetical protein
MDFALQSLPDAFKRAAYQKAHSSYRLFGFLLATPADRHLIPELLMHFNELHHATGDELLLIAPSIHMRLGREGREPTPEEAIAVFERGIFPAYMGSGTQLVNVGDQVKRFLSSLTEQSYELAAFLGLERSRIPCLLFFERLVLPPEFVCWGLERSYAYDVIRRLRTILDQLHQRCGWDLSRRIATIERQLSRSDLGESAADKWKAEELHARLASGKDTVAYLSALRGMRDACQALTTAGSRDLPLERARGNIQRLCVEPDNDQFTTYVRRQRANWKKRLPSEYLDAVDRFLALATKRKEFWQSAPAGDGLEERITAAHQAVVSTAEQLEQQLKVIEAAPTLARQALERELAALRKARTDAIASPLEALRSMGLRDVRRSQPDYRPPSSTVAGLFEYLSCFISYSSRDSEFAKRLHADLVGQGVRCWFAPEDLRIGDKFRQRIDDSIQSHDKLLLILSAESIRSAWVEAEVEAAFEKERKENRVVLFPIKLDDEIMDTQFSWAALLRRTRHIGDFREAAAGVAYETAMNRLLRDLRTEEASSPSA